MQLLRTTGMTNLDSNPLWDRAELSSEELLAEYHRECGIVRRGINGDLTKARSGTACQCPCLTCQAVALGADACDMLR